MADIEEVKNNIAEATKSLIRAHSIDTITVTEICDKANVNRRTFYRYFHDKYEVVEWIYYHDALVNSEHFKDWSVFDYMSRILESLYEDRKYYVNALKYHGQNSFRDYCTKQMTRLIVPKYNNVFADEKELAFFVKHLCEMTYNASVEWLSEEPCLTPQEFEKKYRLFLINAFSVSYKLLTNKTKEKIPIDEYNFQEPTKHEKKEKY